MNKNIIKRYLSALVIAVILITAFFGCSRGEELPEYQEGPATTVSTTTQAVITTATTATTSVTSTTASTTTTTTKPSISVSVGSTAKDDKTAPPLSTSKSTENSTLATTKAKGGHKSTTSAIKKTTKNSSSTTSTTTISEPTLPANACTVDVECKVILSNMDKLKAGHAAYVPKDGYIIKNYIYTVGNDDNVYDALKQACSDKGVKLTAQSTSMGTYIAGIGNIDEKDCGATSGWKYMVNGSYPAFSVDKYTISPKDKIVFTYVLQP